MFRIRMATQFVVMLLVGLSAGNVLGLTGPPPPALVIVAAGCALWLASCRTTWLPFLGPTAFPTGALALRTPPRANVAIAVAAPRGAIKVVYWAAVHDAADPIQAYGGFGNSGVADVAADGTAILRFRNPPSYQVHGKRLQPHVHYRWVFANGLLSGVRTRGA